MLQTITIAGTASYNTQQSLTGLRAINFIFGTNGSGKTTISRVINDPASRGTCSLGWTGGRDVERLVYNSDFCGRNFAQQMRGIFTLGATEGDTIAQIEAARAKVAEYNDQIAKLEDTLGAADLSTGKRAELSLLRSAFEVKCWGIKTAHDPHFQEAFTGFRSSKVSFCDKMLAELEENEAELATLDDLKARAVTVFEKGLERIALLTSINGSDLIALELNPVLAKKVVGKEDIDIAALIRRLGNSDWVRQGLTYVDDSGERCPFCQQDIDADLSRKMNEYFDETYLRDIAEIDRMIDAYGAYSSDLTAKIEAALASGNKYVDVAELRAHLDRLAARVDLNLRQLDRKKKEASSQIELESLSGFVEAISAIIASANEAVQKHNSMVDNLSAERTKLIAQIWKCLLEESKSDLSAYATSKRALDSAVQGISAGIATKTAQRATVQSDLAELEKSVTSVQPTVTEINAILKSFGFTGFSLATAGEHNNLYEIVRGNGEEAATTLSEGERSFVTFLYFYHLIRGSMTTSGMNAERIVVFDDPVSSLDSDVLFIVSALIKRVLDEACSGDGRIKQVFVLTHNIYFHKEVSFDAKRTRECRAHETFWIVRKVQDQSVITAYGHNPISTSYELLWAEVRSPNRSNMTIQNTLRRILENYFKILGNLDKDDVVVKFEGRDQQICGSLYSWVNDGSHSFHDDFYISADDAIVARYLDVFRRIFVHTGHTAHYEMMMGPEALAREQEVAEEGDAGDEAEAA